MIHPFLPRSYSPPKRISTINFRRVPARRAVLILTLSGLIFKTPALDPHFSP
jgi:hypothetical protein